MSAEFLEAANSRLRYDRKILKIFGVTAGVFFSIVLISLLVARAPILSVLANALAVGIVVAVCICGIIELWHNRKASRISKRNIRKLVLVSVVAMWLVLLLILAVIVAHPEIVPDSGLPFEFSAGEIIAIVVATLFASMLTVATASILAFGAIGLMSALTRLYTPGILIRVKAISERKTWRESALAWVFGIPDTLDTRTLSVAVPVAEDEFPRRTFAQAVAWELVLGVILAIYVAFNPLALNRSADSVSRLFGILGTAALLVPLVTVPWFIYTSVGATIRGMTKDFRLYDGIKARIFRSYIAIGTIVVFIRISLSEAQLQGYIVNLAQYILSLVVAAVLFTFVYFNYFDRELTKDIIVRYNELAR